MEEFIDTVRSNLRTLSHECKRGCAYPEAQTVALMDELNRVGLWPASERARDSVKQSLDKMSKVHFSTTTRCKPCGEGACEEACDFLQLGGVQTRAFRGAATSVEQDIPLPCLDCCVGGEAYRSNNCQHEQQTV